MNYKSLLSFFTFFLLLNIGIANARSQENEVEWCTKLYDSDNTICNFPITDTHFVGDVYKLSDDPGYIKRYFQFPLWRSLRWFAVTFSNGGNFVVPTKLGSLAADEDLYKELNFKKMAPINSKTMKITGFVDGQPVERDILLSSAAKSKLELSNINSATLEAALPAEYVSASGGVDYKSAKKVSLVLDDVRFYGINPPDLHFLLTQNSNQIKNKHLRHLLDRGVISTDLKKKQDFWIMVENQMNYTNSMKYTANNDTNASGHIKLSPAINPPATPGNNPSSKEQDNSGGGANAQLKVSHESHGAAEYATPDNIVLATGSHLNCYHLKRLPAPDSEGNEFQHTYEVLEYYPF